AMTAAARSPGCLLRLMTPTAVRAPGREMEPPTVPHGPHAGGLTRRQSGCHRNVSDRTSPPGTDFVRLVRERNAIGEASEPLMCGRRFSYRCEPAAHQPPRQPESAVG